MNFLFAKICGLNRIARKIRSTLTVVKLSLKFGWSFDDDLKDDDVVPVVAHSIDVIYAEHGQQSDLA